MKTAYMGSKTEAQLIALIGVGFLLFISLFNDPDGDFGFVSSQLYWTKAHLLNSLEFPYFTPALCGGFLLGAEPQNTIFTLLQLIYFLLRIRRLHIDWGYFF